MMNKIFTITTLILITFNVMAGKNQVFRQSGVIKIVSEDLTPSLAVEQQQDLSQYFINYQVAEVNASQVLQLINKDDQFPEMHLSLAGHEWDLQLQEKHLKSADYKLLINSPEGSRMEDGSKAVFYKGYANNDPQNRVRLTLDNGLFSGMITENGQTYFVESLKRFSNRAVSDNQVVIYSAEDVIAAGKLGCAADDLEFVTNKQQANDQTASAAACVVTEIVIYAESDVYFRFNEDAAALENHLLYILNLVDGYFEEHDIEYVTNGIGISTAPSTDVNKSQSTDIETFLDAWANYAQATDFPFEYDVASIHGDKNYSGSGMSSVTGVARLAGLSDNCYFPFNALEFIPQAALAAVNQTHELGHNWGCPHANATGSSIMNASISLTNRTWSAANSNVIATSKSVSCVQDLSCTDAPQALFHISSREVCFGEEISFFDNSLKNPTSWLWDFGDGTTSTEQNPVHAYTSSGNYTVSLTVKNSNGSSDTRTQENYISVNPNRNSESVFIGKENKGTGGYRPRPTNGSGIYMKFEAISDVELVSFKVYSNKAAYRHFQFTKGGSSIPYDDLVVFIPAGESRVRINKRFLPGNYKLWLSSAYEWELWRDTQGASYPQAVSGLLSITGNNAMDAGTAGADAAWDIGYDWAVRRVTCSGPVSMPEEVSENDGLTVYPNPGNGFFNIEWNSGEALNKTEIKVYNLIGEMVYEKTFATSGKIKHQINLSDLPSGVYIIQTEVKNQVYRQKLIKE